MRAFTKSSTFRLSLLLLILIPMAVLATTTHFAERSLLKEALSIVTILAFFQLIGQFFWARTNKSAVRQLTMSRILKYHKSTGYIFVVIMLFHPFYVVLPRFFEAGVSPGDAFITMITTMNTGIVLGIIAWFLMLGLAVTSFIRNKLPMSYKSWRRLHGILATLFLLTAVWHAIDLGRHASLSMSILFCVLAAGGLLLLLKTYFFKK